MGIAALIIYFLVWITHGHPDLPTTRWTPWTIALLGLLGFNSLHRAARRKS